MHLIDVSYALKHCIGAVMILFSDDNWHHSVLLRRHNKAQFLMEVKSNINDPNVYQLARE